MISDDQIQDANILIVDDNLVNVLALKKILNAHSFNNIDSYKPEGDEPFVIDENCYPELVILNLDLEEFISTDVISTVRNYSTQKPIPILVFTRNIDAHKTDVALRTGATDLLWVPFAENEVIARTRVLLENHFMKHILSEQDVGDAINNHLQVVELQRQLENSRKSESEKMLLAYQDPLTGLKNSSALFQHLKEILVDIKEKRRDIAVWLFSLEKFSEISKTLGFESGDEILKTVAKRINSSVEKMRDKRKVGNYKHNMFCARYSGGKFVVVLDHLDSETSAVSMAHRILAGVSSPYELPGIVLEINTQVGITLAPRYGDDAGELLRQAEVALQSAKTSNQPMVVYENSLDNYDPLRLALMAELRHAINNDALHLVYQPKFNIKTGVISGVEALLRWDHPQRGLIPPMEFIPLAEQSSVIKPLTVWVLNVAMRQAMEFAKSNIDIAIAVNISASSLRDDSLVGYVKMLLNKNHVDPDRVILEITESAMIQDPAMGLKILNQLNNLGVEISIDDYGTGYSSLAYLKRLPVTEMKIDREFIKDMAVDEDDKLIVGTSIKMGHSFGLRVIAEGVEDKETVRILKELDCDQVQGMYYASPMKVDDLYDWMALDNKVAWRIA